MCTTNSIDGVGKVVLFKYSHWHYREPSPYMLVLCLQICYYTSQTFEYWDNFWKLVTAHKVYVMVCIRKVVY